MTDFFSYNKQANMFDNLVVDVPKVYEDYPLVKESDAGVNKVLFVADFFRTRRYSAQVPGLWPQGGHGVMLLR